MIASFATSLLLLNDFFLGQAMHKIINSHESGGLGCGDYFILAIVIIWIKGGVSLLLSHNNSDSIHSMSKKA
jgi:hypothetical protein